MEINIFQVDAFSSKPFGGNPAGVVPDAKWLKESDMQKIANEMNLSETAFVIQRDDNLFKIKFYTPLCEIDLCGHATIATFYTLAEQGYIKPIESGIKKVFMETNIGRLPVEIEFFNNLPEHIVMEQGEPKTIGKLENLSKLVDILNIKMSDIGIDDYFIEPEIISTGLPDIMLPIRDKKVLDSIQMDFCELSNYCKELNVVGVHAFHMPEKDSFEIYARNFAPLVGINEESATGTANGCLIYYLKKNSLINRDKIMVLQGESLNRPSEVYCHIEEDNDTFKIKVGGRANITLEGIIKF